MFANIKKQILDSIFPPRCIACDKISDETPICKDCNSKINWLETDFFSSTLDKIYFDKAKSLAAYDGAFSQIIHNIKYNRRTDLIKPLALVVSSKINFEYDIVTAVPLHWLRLFKRGFNQSALLARLVAKECGFKCDLSILKKIKRTSAQVGLIQKERLENIKGAFICRKSLQDMDVLLIDDVMTTGATVNECAKVIKKAGANRVDVFTLARTAY